MNDENLDDMVFYRFETEYESIEVFEINLKRWELLASGGEYKIEDYVYAIETNFNLYYVDTYHKKVIKYPRYSKIYVRLVGMLGKNWLNCVDETAGRIKYE